MPSLCSARRSEGRIGSAKASDFLFRIGMCVAEEDEEEDEGMVFIVSNLPKWDMGFDKLEEEEKEKGKRKNSTVFLKIFNSTSR